MTEIRRATTNDVEAIIDLMYEAYEPVRALGIQFESAYPTVEKVTNNIQQNLCYVYEIDDELISTISLRMPWSLNPGPYYFPHIWWFATSPKFKGKGIGTTLLKYVEEKIIKEELNSPAVTLGTANNHPWLVEMYERKNYDKFGSKDLGKGHITQYFIKILNENLFQGTAVLQRKFTDVVYEEDINHGF